MSCVWCGVVCVVCGGAGYMMCDVCCVVLYDVYCGLCVVCDVWCDTIGV